MHQDWKDLIRMFSLVEGETESLLETEAIIHKIGEQTDDQKRAEKYNYIQEHFDEVVSLFSGKFGSIKQICSKDDCRKCFANKWCNHYRNKVQKEEAVTSNRLIYADFFCGAGGLSWGFHMAGFKMSLANDIQECCIDTISLNHPEVPGQYIVAGDINNVIDNIRELSRYSHVDVVVGGPPCQGFSTANQQRLIDDPRNHLYKSFIKAIGELQPKFFVMENVRGMLKAKVQIEEDFSNIGYTATAQILNAKDFGVPQNRERVIFIGNRIGEDNVKIFDKILAFSEKRQPVVLSDALQGMPYLQAKTVPNATEIEDDMSGYTIALNANPSVSKYIDLINESRNVIFLFNHKARYNNERDVEIFRRMNPGDNSADPKIADIMPYRRRERIFKDKYFRLEPDKPCKTITAHMRYDCNMYIHPFQARGLTPREAARVQSYPDDYFFRGPYTKTYMQVGNSVPPLMSATIAKVLKDVLREVH